MNIKHALKESMILNNFLESMILVSHSINQNKEFLFMYPEYELSDIEHKNLNGFINRRLNNEPIAYIIGYKEFWGLDFIVNKHSLIPRPETELFLDFLKSSNFFYDHEKKTILDLGTGSGCILISILHEFKEANGLGIDIDLNTIAVAHKNAIKHNVNDRCHFLISNWLDALNATFDLIVSNPPYISLDSLEVAKETKEYEPINALYAGYQGLESYNKIAINIGNYLKKDGLLLIEIGYNQELVKDIFISNDKTIYFVDLIKDLSNKPRILVFKKL